MVVSIIVISGIFIALTLTACAVINKDTQNDDNKCSGCPYKSECTKMIMMNNLFLGFFFEFWVSVLIIYSFVINF